MPEYTELLATDSEFWEKCARHSTKQTTRHLAYLYLCDDCVKRLVEGALNGRPPIYHGETVEGYCGLCNERKAVTFRQWFICERCFPVVAKYQRAPASPQALAEFWAKHVSPSTPSFVIAEKDKVVLSPFIPGGKTKRQQAESLEDSDFLVSEIVGSDQQSRFHIELKAGPGSIDSMKEFQLDVNDYNDVVGVIRKTGLPAYVIHVQLGYRYDPPTRQSYALKMWWSDIPTLAASMKRVAQRQDEKKLAIYFKPSAFQSIETFPSVITERRFEALAAQFAKSPPEFVELPGA